MGEVELGNILLTTVISLITFILANLYVEPFRQYKHLKVRTNYLLVLYSDRICNPIDLADVPNNKLPDEYQEASQVLRELAAEWISFKLYKNFLNCFIVSTKKLNNIGSKLILLSNSLTYPYNCKNLNDIRDNKKVIDEIRRVLRIK